MATPATQIIESLRAWLTRTPGGFDFSQYARPIIENLRISQCLNALSDYFDEQTRAGLPDLNLGDNITPYEITTVATATQSFRGADNNAVFSASFNLNYMEVQNGF